MAKNMGMKGVKQGDMSPSVDDIQRPASNYSQEGFSRTLDYIERQNGFVAKEAKEVKSQAYKGRYS